MGSNWLATKSGPELQALLHLQHVSVRLACHSLACTFDEQINASCTCPPSCGNISCNHHALRTAPAIPEFQLGNMTSKGPGGWRLQAKVYEEQEMQVSGYSDRLRNRLLSTRYLPQRLHLVLREPVAMFSHLNRNSLLSSDRITPTSCPPPAEIARNNAPKRQKYVFKLQMTSHHERCLLCTHT